MYYLTTYWFSAQNSNSYLLKEKVLDINTLCSLWRHYQYTNITHVITHMNFLHVIPTESQSCLFSSCNSTHTHALHLPYKCCTKPFPTWAKVQPHLMLDARSLYSVSPCEPYCWNTHNHTASVRITDVLHRETDCCHHTPYSYYVTSEIGNYIVKAMKKKPYCEDPNTGR